MPENDSATGDPVTPAPPDAAAVNVNAKRPLEPSDTNPLTTPVHKRPKLTAEEKVAIVLAKEQEKEKKRLEKEQKDAEKEQRRLEKEVEKQKKEEERRAKEEERRVKEEERQRKLEEKRLEDEEKRKEKERREQEKERKRLEKERELQEKEREKERELRKKEKQSAQLMAFFKKATPSKTGDTSTSLKGSPTDRSPFDQYFLPFEIKNHVIVAPILRRTDRPSTQVIDEALTSAADVEADVLLREFILLRQRNSDSSASSAQTLQPYQPLKLVQFHDNLRPAYFGTFSKTSTAITPQRPLARDTGLFNYDVDSDEEWEEEEEGEEIASNDEEEVADGAEEEDEEDGFVVPHGYLSDDEGAADHDDRLARNDCSDTARRRSEPLQPKVVSCVIPDDGTTIHNKPEELQFLKTFRVISFQVPIIVATVEPELRTPVASAKKSVPLDVVRQILSDIHGSELTKEALVIILNERYPQASKSSIRNLMATSTTKEKREGATSQRWYVRTELLKQHNVPVKPIAIAPPAAVSSSPSQPDIMSFFNGNAVKRSKKPSGSGKDSPCASSPSPNKPMPMDLCSPPPSTNTHSVAS